MDLEKLFQRSAQIEDCLRLLQGQDRAMFAGPVSGALRDVIAIQERFLNAAESLVDAVRRNGVPLGHE